MADFTVKNAADMRDDMCRVYRAGMIDRGVENPNVTPGSEPYVLFTAVASQLEIAMANAQVKADEGMPDTATGDALDRVCQVYGLTRRAAAGATGYIVLDSTAATTITEGDQLTDGAGLRFEVVTTGTYSDGDLVEVAGVDTGTVTNHEEGDTLRWVSTPAFAASTALVAPGGLTGGIDEELDETLRARLYERLRNPPKAGNWEHIAELAEASDPVVQKAAVYPALNGPGTYGVSVWGYTSATSKSREIDTAKVTGTIEPYITGNVAEHAAGYITTVSNRVADVSILINIPSAKTASPPGIGGGWKNGTPWPIPQSGYYFSAVTTVHSTSELSIRCSQAPRSISSGTDGITKIAWLSYTDWTLYTATVTTVVSYAANIARVILSSPFPGIVADDYVMPDAVNLQAYVDALLEGFEEMGPGERTDSAGALPYAYRRPRPGNSWPYSLGGWQLKKIVDSGDEVYDAQWNYRKHTAETLTGSAGVLTPGVRALYSQAPYILVPRRAAFYPLT